MPPEAPPHHVGSQPTCARCEYPVPELGTRAYAVWELHREVFDVGGGIGDLICPPCLTDAERATIVAETGRTEINNLRPPS